ncbi:type II toxin-antitoxin system HipA family toxin [Bifidobacterium sp. ESL0784]|uniref:type II toxin-antitoxin system HipA family toxin n=1 Tax=Bifidobacterium sp. ESL0784 TaxID=2983231 RepID=UPI0023F8C338|nr:type II toxin-antitoxin system HipA family toxin [Bifidobacterium sp. ESL0784]MDF7640206.1 type II toxin-antitoxin system HipA family toxin [Bifidobacterium sp. ESL0784]
MKTKELRVYLEGRPIGLLREDKNGKHSFLYDNNAEGQLSLSMPPQLEPWTGKPIEAYIDGVLPDDRTMRQRIGRLYDVSANNPFALLTAIGLDCAGGAQFVSPDNLDLLEEPETLRPIAKGKIGKRLTNLASNVPTTWQGPNEHWSLNGAQGKIALRQNNGEWFEALGAAATTHILKPGVSQLHEQAFNEYICMKTLEKLDISVSQSAFQSFNGTPAIVSTRWDRREKQDAHGQTHIARIHQEDICQAMSYMTRQKYQSDGGPNANSIIAFLRTNALAETDIIQFTTGLMLNFLIGGTDAHAKNYAILEPVGEAPRLAPFYDIASIFAYDARGDRKGERKMAMSIGGEYHYERIELKHWLKLCQDTKLDEELIAALLKHYAEILPDTFNDTAKIALADVAKLKISPESLTTPNGSSATKRKELVNRIGAGIKRQCDMVLGW